MFLDGIHQSLWVRGTDIQVNVQTVRCAADDNHFSAEFVKNFWGHLVCSTVSAVHHDLQTPQRKVVGEGALTKLDVAPRRILQAAGAAQACGIGPHGCFVHGGFHRQLPGVRQLGALRAEKLDTVVVKRIVARADDDAQRSALRAGEVCHAWRWQWPEQYHIDTGRVKTALQCALQHIARNTCVFADQDGRTRLGSLEHAPHSMRKPKDEVWRDRRFTHGATNTIGAKVFSAHVDLSLVSY